MLKKRCKIAMLTVLAPAIFAVGMPSSGASANVGVLSGRVDRQGDGWDAHALEVSAVGAITAKLEWANEAADLNLGLQDPSGKWVAWSSAPRGTTESISFHASVVGTWKLGVVSRVASAEYRLTTSQVSVDSPTPTTTPPASGGATMLRWGAEQESPSHDWSEVEAVAAAHRFDLITAIPGAYRRHVHQMRLANPSLSILAYTNGGYAYNTQRDTFPASWYLYDRDGNKIRNNWGLWLMDPARPEWVDSRVQHCLDAVAYSGYDGCFVDNLGVGSIYAPTLTGVPLNPRTKQPYTNADWLRATSALAGRVADGASVPIMANGLMNGTAYFDSSAPSSQLALASGFALAETFVRTANQGVKEHRTEDQWKRDVDMLVDAGNRGARVAAATKVWVTATQAEKEAWHRFALATFLLGDNGTNAFHFSYGRRTVTMLGHPLEMTELGRAVGAYAKVGNVYQREFTGGRAVVNPTAQAVTVRLDREYVDTTGAAIRTLSLAPYDGAILRG